MAPDVTCDLQAALLPGADSTPITVMAIVEPEAFPEVINTTVVSTSTPESDTANNAASDPVEVPELVDLAIAKTHEEPVEVGATTTWTLSVTNNGPIDDPAVVAVTDELPAGLTPTAATSDDADCTVEGQLVTCTRDDGLAVDDGFTVDVETDVLPEAYPEVVNEAEVSSPTDDVDPSNNTAQDTAEVPPLVDLSITKDHVDPVAVGDTMTWTMVVTNAGPTVDPGPVTVTDVLPDGLTPVAAAGDGMDCTIAAQLVTCAVLDVMEVGESLVLEVDTQVGPEAAPGVENTVEVSTESPEVDLANNVAVDAAEVSPAVGLGVTKTLADQDDDLATWTLEVVNTGPNDTVEPIVATDDLPDGLVYVSANGVGWACQGTPATVTCTYDESVAAGAGAPPVELVTRIEAPSGTEITNVVMAGGGGPDTEEVTDSDTVVAPDAPDPSPFPLPRTGADAWRLLLCALLLVGVGTALTRLAARAPGRRRSGPA